MVAFICLNTIRVAAEYLVRKTASIPSVGNSGNSVIFPD